MLLIIEDKDDPTEPIAEETEDGSELLYIPVIKVPVKGDVQRDCALDRILFDFHRGEAPQRLEPEQPGRLVPLFLRALGRTGTRPEYITPSAFSDGETGTKFCARG